jgi:hypothetical protein
MSFNNTVMQFQNGLIVGRDGGVIPPSTYKVSTSDVDLDSKRSTAGYLTRNRIRGGNTTAYTLEVSWDRISWEQLQTLIAAGDAESFTVKFLDPKSKGGYTTKTMYRQADMEYTMINISGLDDAFWSTTMSFVEF